MIMHRNFLLLFFSLATFNGRSQEIGLQLYSFRKQIPSDIPGTFQKIRSMGIHELEGGDTYGMSMEAYKKILADNRMKMVSIGAEYNLLQTNIDSVVHEAKAFGASYVVCFWIPHTGTSLTAEEAKKAAAVFNAAGKIFKDNSLKFCYHPHGYEFAPYADGNVFDLLAKELDPARVNFEMDVFWVKQAGLDPVGLLKRYPGRFLLMHLKDRRPGTPDSQDGKADEESNVVLGQGDVGIPAIMAIARKSGVKHFFIEDESSRPLEQVPASLTFLRQIQR